MFLRRIAVLLILSALCHLVANATEIPNPCSPLGAQKIAVILANYEGSPKDTATPSLSYVSELFSSTSNLFSISDYYKTVSGGRTWFDSVSILGPYQSPLPFIADPNQNAGVQRALDGWQTSLLQLAGKDFDFSKIDRVVFITPNAIDKNGAPVMMAAGLAGQGVCDIDSVNANGVHHKVAHAWVLARTEYQGINLQNLTGGTVLSSTALQAAIRRQKMSDIAPIIHELGHTFGLGHANQVNRPQPNYHNQFMNDEILPGANQTLYQNSYADPFSAMGAGEIQWLNVPHLSQLGWLNPNQVEEVRKAGIYRIYPLELNDGKLKGLKIPRVIQSPNESTLSDLWVEYRERSSVYDTELTGIVHTTQGAIVHYTNPKQPGPNSIWPFETVLLNFQADGTPVNPYETNLTLTHEWKDDHSMVDLDVIDVTSDYLDINVAFK